MVTKTPVEDLSYEQAFDELEAIVGELEGGQRPLEESMALFERGQALVQRLSALLEEAELRIRSVSESDTDEA